MFQSIHFNAKPRATTNASKPEVIEKLKQIVGAENVLVEPDKVEPYGADAVKEKFPPEAVVFPETTEQMSEILKLANAEIFPVTARGGGVGYTGGAVPVDGGIVIGTDRMNKIIEINADDLYVICQPGLTTFELQQAVEKYGLLFPPDPASYKDSFIGGNIAENAGGMRTPKYGVTKHSVLGLEVVTATGEIIRTGGRTVKNVVGFRSDRIDVRKRRTFGNHHRSDFETFADARSDGDRSRFIQINGSGVRSLNKIHAGRFTADGDGSHRPQLYRCYRTKFRVRFFARNRSDLACRG